jgi:membrane protein DedA with SNARE-associated domain
MVELAIDVINQIGLLGAGLLIAIEVIVLPIPSEVVLLLTGFNAALGNFSFFGAVAATTIGSVAGATLLYTLGYTFSKSRLEAIVIRYGKYVGINISDLTKTFNWFDRHGTYLVFFGRLLPVIRSLVSVPAGLIQMSMPKFLLLTTAGSAIWNSIWISIGSALGDSWERAEAWAVIIDYVVYAAVVIAFFGLGFKLWQRKLRRKNNNSDI